MNIYRVYYVKVFLSICLFLVLGQLLLVEFHKFVQHKSKVYLNNKYIDQNQEEEFEKNEDSNKKSIKSEVKESSKTIGIVFQVPEINQQYAKYASYDNEITKYFKEYFDNTDKSSNNKARTFHIILEYTKIFSQPKFCHLNINSYYHKNSPLFKKLLAEKQKDTRVFDLLDKCAYKNCFFTCDKTLAQDSSALLFHATDLENEIKNQVKDGDDAVQLKQFINQYIPFKRDPDQPWIIWHDEPNTLSKSLDSFKMNWTISFNSKSEVSYGAYGAYIKTTSRLTDRDFNKKILKQFNSRKNQSVWFVSNCGPKLRQKFTVELTNFHHVHIYGKCSGSINEIPGEKRFMHTNTDCERNSDCEREVYNSFKFFIAFESQNCTDYITEKFWRSLDYDLIPIVLQPSKETYERLAPPKSFIHAEDFNFDAEKLAKYLEEVYSNFNVYLSHMAWKNEYKAYYKAEEVEMMRICEMCYKINTIKQSKQYSHYKSVSNWFNGQCDRN